MKKFRGMNKDKIKSTLSKLISEAPIIAPAIVILDGHNYGQVNDKELDVQLAQRWTFEVDSVLSGLSEFNSHIFGRVNAEYLELKEESLSFHSRSIFLHKALHILESASQLMESEILESTKLVSNEIEVPAKVTLSWLFKHVPIHLWAAALALILASYSFGVTSSSYGFVQELYGIKYQEKGSVPFSP